MNTNIQRGLKICFTIIGTNIGAGFATGREIWEFFGSYGTKSTIYLLLAMTLFALASMIVLWISWKQQTEHYFNVLKHIMGRRFAHCFDGLILLYLLSSSLIMFAGSGATFSQWEFPYLLGVFVLALAVWFVLFFDVEGLMSINVVLVPFLTVVLIAVCLTFLYHGEARPLTVSTSIEWFPVWPSAVTYAALNAIPLMAVLATLGKEIRHPVEIGIAGLGSGVCLGGVAILYNLSLLRVDHLIPQYDIPLFALMNTYSSVWVALISIVLWVAIYTTAVSGVYGAVFRISSWIALPRWMIALAVICVIVPLSQFGFTELVGFLYPVYGILNLFVLASILLYPVANMRTSLDKPG